MNATQGGLGRGLAAILTGPTPAADDSLRARFIDSALASLRAGAQLTVCGYVHDLAGAELVVLKAPDLHSLHPTQAFQLFAGLGSFAGADVGAHRLELSDGPTIAVVTESSRFRGMYFFGGPDLTDETSERLIGFCRVYAPIIHDHDRPVDETERVHLMVDQQGDGAHAEVTLGDNTGFSSAIAVHEAVAGAAIATLAPSAKLIEVGEVRSGDGAAAYVVAAGEQGRLATGAAPVTAGPNAAAAVAAIRAGRNLTEG